MGTEARRTPAGGAQGTASQTLVDAVSRLKRAPRLPAGAEIVLRDGVFDLKAADLRIYGADPASLTAPFFEHVLSELADGHAALLFIGEPGGTPLAQLPAKTLLAVVRPDASATELALAVEGLAERIELRHHAEKKGRWLERYRYELGELIEIARAITQERDIHRLLDIILERSRFITGADAGSIYVVEGQDPDPQKRTLRFKLSQNDSCDFESSEFTMPVSTRSIAGYAVVTRSSINIKDVYDIPEGSPYGFDASFDQRMGYRTRSLLTVPMISAEDEVIGVIQLINRKRDADNILDSVDAVDADVITFDERCQDMLETLASQAGIALENALLYDEIKRIFEGFVHASVQAIEQRDPTTSGHSLRVSVLSCELARVVDRVDAGPYAAASFTRRQLKELEYASLLHDFGKIGVREQVLVKAKKLYPHQLESVRERIHYAIKALEADLLAQKIELIGRGAGPDAVETVDRQLRAKRTELEEAWRVICEANEPTVLSEGDFTRIAEIGRMTYVRGTGETALVLTPEEVESLHVTRGSLNLSEVSEIQSHVVHTFNFLAKIPWGKTFTQIPEIAGAHHEKLDGSGYPDKLTGDEIPMQSKIMTIADIYDALTARDRPYKKAVPVERALDILGFEVDAGHVDGELVRLFREAAIFHAVEGIDEGS